MIHGATNKRLVTHPDDRGFFREVIRRTDAFFGEGFAQWSHSRMETNVVKAWHYHHRQVDWWYVAIGELEVVLYDMRTDSPTSREKSVLSLNQQEPSVLKIPPGVAHGLKVTSPEAHLFYVTSRTYDPADEGRLPFDSDTIPHAWGDPATLIVADRDRRRHVPPYPRPTALTV